MVKREFCVFGQFFLGCVTNFLIHVLPTKL